MLKHQKIESSCMTEEELPTLRDWLTLLQTNYDKSIDDQVKNIDAAEKGIERLITASNQQLLRELEGQAVDVETTSGYEDYIPLSIIRDKLKEYGEEL